jgi:hypothetical protein
LAISFFLILRFKKSGDKKRLLVDLLLFGVLLLSTYYARALFVSKALFVAHISLLIYAYYNFYLRIFKNKKEYILILLPLLTLALFFLFGEFFRHYA